MSDNGPQMRSNDTREYMAVCSIAQHFGRPGTPTDQAWVESLFGHVKGENPWLTQIHDPPDPTAGTGQSPGALQHDPAARNHRLHHPRRRARMPRLTDPTGTNRRHEPSSSPPNCDPQTGPQGWTKRTRDKCPVKPRICDIKSETPQLLMPSTNTIDSLKVLVVARRVLNWRRNARVGIVLAGSHRS